MCKKSIYLISLAFMVGFVLTSVANASDPNLLGLWKLDSDVNDSSGNDHHGVIFGNPKWVAGYHGGALEFDDFDGVNDRVEMPTTDAATGFSFVGELTWAFWMKSPGNPDGTGSLMYLGPPGGAQVWGHKGLTLETDGTIMMRATAVSAATKHKSRDAVNDDMWHHIAITIEFETDGDNDTMKVYIDGDLDRGYATDAVNINMRDSSRDVSGYIIILGYMIDGQMIDKPPSSWPARLHGLLDDVRVYNRALTNAEINEIMVGPEFAAAPNPPNAMTNVPRDIVLSWTAGAFAETHDVYLGTAFDDVNDATRANPLGVLASQNQAPSVYAPPERLVLGQTYYWRIDEVSGPPDYTIFEGRVWQFTVEPVGYPIDGQNITATASSILQPDMGPENTVNGSGLDADNLHSAEATDMWLSSSEPQGAWIQYEFDKVYKLHEMWIWNFNKEGLNTMSGLRDVAVEYSIDGDIYTQLGTYEFAEAPGMAGYAHNPTVDLGNVLAKYVRISANSNWSDGIVDQYGLSEVLFFSIPVYASEPVPDSGATDISIGTIDEPIDVNLGFKAGREAIKHDVYFSSDEKAVIDSTAAVTTVTETSYGPLSLDVGQTYYWRVDEVNEAETPTTWQGDIWNFRTQEFFVVDDFEDYNDYPPDEIFSTWIDGWDIPTNGSTVGYPEPDFAAGEHFVETNIVHSGKQSMPFGYNNTAGVVYSEAARTFTSPKDWTQRGIGALSLRFKGLPASGIFTYDADTQSHMVIGGGSRIGDISDHFHYVYTRLNGHGSITAKVESIAPTHKWARSGVMVRQTLEPDSVNAFMAVTAPGSQNRARFQYRDLKGDTTGFVQTPKNAVELPHWVRLTRAGSIFTAEHSADGITWEAFQTQDIVMGMDVYIGLAVCSQNTSALCEAVFSNVSVTGDVTPAGPFSTSVDIGIDSNLKEQLYLALEDSAGIVNIVKHPDLSSTQQAQWQEWSIDLKMFSDVGVNLRAIKKIIIGVGDRDNPTPGSAGTLYFDDIRLCSPPEPDTDSIGN